MELTPLGLRSVGIAVLRISVVAYLFVMLILFLFQEKILFIPDKLPENFQFRFRQPFNERFFELGSIKIHSLLFKAENSHGLILYFHGNAGNLESWGQVGEELARQFGWDVWMLDYPGYGKSGGKISSEDQLLEMAEAFWRLAREEYPQVPVLIFGRSIGSGMAVKLAALHPCKGLILETPFYNLRNLATSRFWWAPTFLLKYTFRSDLWIKDVRSPVLVLHGTDDEVIPFQEGERLTGLINDVEFVRVPGGHHNDLSMHDLYAQRLEKWLRALE